MKKIFLPSLFILLISVSPYSQQPSPEIKLIQNKAGQTIGYSTNSGIKILKLI